MSVDPTIQRSIGRIEGKLDQLLLEMTRIRNDFGEHKDQDQVAFSAVRNLVFTSRDEIKQQFQEHAKSRDEHLDAQDVKLNALSVENQKLQTQDENTRTVGAYILAVFGSLAAIIGAAVIAALNGHIKIH